jgi:hypothetical protein
MNKFLYFKLVSVDLERLNSFQKDFCRILKQTNDKKILGITLEIWEKHFSIVQLCKRRGQS